MPAISLSGICTGTRDAHVGLAQSWPECACEALALHLLAREGPLAPVFGGDLNQHIILHEADVDTWHVAQSTPEQQSLAVQAMRNLVKARLQQVNELAAGGLLSCENI